MLSLLLQFGRRELSAQQACDQWLHLCCSRMYSQHLYSNKPESPPARARSWHPASCRAVQLRCPSFGPTFLCSWLLKTEEGRHFRPKAASFFVARVLSFQGHAI